MATNITLDNAIEILAANDCEISEEQVELAERTLNYIAKHPERHAQDKWILLDGTKPDAKVDAYSCGTAACFAGWATLLAGQQIDVRTEGVVGTEMTVQNWAIDTLGLPLWDGSTLHPFAASNSIDDLEVWVQAMREHSKMTRESENS